MPGWAWPRSAGIYVSEGEIEIVDERFEAARMMVFRPGDDITVKALRFSRLMLLGGATLGPPRYIWWSYVASSREKIEEAGAAWAAGNWHHGRFQLPSSDSAEHIPLPER